MSEDKETRSPQLGLDRFTERLEGWRQSKEDKRAEGQLTGQKARGMFEKLFSRVFYGAIYAIVTAVCIFVGRIPTLFLVLAMAWLSCSEFYRIARLGGRMPNEVFGLASALLFPVAAHLEQLTALSFVLFLLIVASSVWYVFTPRANISDVAITIFGPIYTSLLLSSLVLLRAALPGSDGAFLTFGCILSIWANDAFAYFIGSRLGRHPLAPRISPHKSWEGFIGGFVFSILVWLLMGLFHIGGLSISLALVTGFFVTIMSVIGDLFESRLKRGVGIKDSGTIMPGHGGMLDRIDSLLFGLLIAYFILLFGGLF